jgi:hypothetical protein
VLWGTPLPLYSFRYRGGWLWGYGSYVAYGKLYKGGVFCRCIGHMTTLEKPENELHECARYTHTRQVVENIEQHNLCYQRHQLQKAWITHVYSHQFTSPRLPVLPFTHRIQQAKGGIMSEPWRRSGQ